MRQSKIYRRKSRRFGVRATGSPLFTVSPDTLVIAPGDSEVITISFQGATDSGAYTAAFAYIDSCGGTHVITANVTVIEAPPLRLAIALDSATAVIGKELIIYVIATPQASRLADVSYVVGYDVAGLQLDSVNAPCNAAVQQSAGTVAVTISSCPGNSSDTITTLYYQALPGFNDSMSVRLRNAVTTQPCDTVMITTDSVITLNYYGLNLVSALLAVYPNPVTGMATVEFSNVQQADVTLSLYDVLGRTVTDYSQRCAQTRNVHDGVFNRRSPKRHVFPRNERRRILRRTPSLRFAIEKSFTG